ncbi:S49 family peptidase [Candidatus Saccharibacteria bacterium]|nr:S49 family peptidase [Candidatus Saccharibacteria bacterium]
MDSPINGRGGHAGRQTGERTQSQPHPPAVPQPQPHKHESFFIKQLKLASSTAVVSSVATLAISFWSGLAFFGMIIGFIILGAMAAGGAGAAGGGYLNSVYGEPGASHQLLSIKLKGPIEGSSDPSDSLGSLFGAPEAVYGYDVKARLLEAVNEGYDGVILEIDSPGGTIFGSKAISDGIKQYRDRTGNPVYAHVQGYAASGAYWAAAGTDKILADAGTGIGSIGVIFGPFTYYNNPTAIDGGLLGGGVVTQGGIEEMYITAGEGKDAGNPFRRLSEKELSIFQESVNDNYNLFVKHVAEGRKISEDEIRNGIGAHLYGEEGALRRKLIDGVASREQAYNELAKAAELQWGEFEVVTDSAEADSPWGAFGARLFGQQKQARSAVAAPPKICSEAAAPMAYHGNLAQLCSQK